VLFTTAPTPILSSQEMRVRRASSLGSSITCSSRRRSRSADCHDQSRPASYGGILSIQIPATATYRLVMDNNTGVGMTSGITAEIGVSGSMEQIWEVAHICSFAPGTP
jgi:hypothetical protein